MKRVLVIDDNADFRGILSELLTESGYAVAASGDAEEALTMCEQEEFQLVLCDLVMPLSIEDASDEASASAMAGVNLVHQLHQRFPALPIVMVSGKLVGGPLKEMMQFGAMATLSKPFGREDLLRTIAQVLEP